MDDKGNFGHYNNFKENFSVQCSYRDFNKICNAIPPALVHLIKNPFSQLKVQAVVPKLKINKLHIRDRKCNNQLIGKAFKCKNFYDYTKLAKIQIHNEVSNTAKNFNYLKWPIPPKAKEEQYKIINNYYPSAETLKKRFGFQVEVCVFCLEELHTIEHLFYSCTVTSQFWQNLYNWLNSSIENINPFDMNQILIYKNANELSDMINIIIIMGKCHLHTCKWKIKKLSLVCFKNKLRSFYSSLLPFTDKYGPIEKLCNHMSLLFGL